MATFFILAPKVLYVPAKTTTMGKIFLTISCVCLLALAGVSAQESSDDKAGSGQKPRADYRSDSGISDTTQYQGADESDSDATTGKYSRKKKRDRSRRSTGTFGGPGSAYGAGNSSGSSPSGTSGASGTTRTSSGAAEGTGADDEGIERNKKGKSRKKSGKE
jgi:hypothetical protein